MADEDKNKTWKDMLGNLLFEEESSETGRDVQGEAPPAPEEAPSPTLYPTGTGADLPSGTGALDLAAIYRRAGIADQQFATPEQILELQKTFADLPAEVQRQKVLKTLGSFKVETAKVVDNTRQKIEAITSFVGDVRNQAVSTIDTSNQTIEGLQKEIDACKKRIIEAQGLLDQVSKQGQTAIDELRGVLQFLGVGAEAPAGETPAKNRTGKSR